ncbi:MAG: hypothetical protein SOT58_10565, partial [Agathobacter sp.]|nr:hypothetical protein [Agathobacter sp.]
IFAPTDKRNMQTALIVETLPPVIIPYWSMIAREIKPDGQIPSPVFFSRLYSPTPRRLMCRPV